jgi:hypothetical protein
METDDDTPEQTTNEATAPENILWSKEGGGDHNGETTGGDESAEDGVLKKVQVRRKGGALGKRV